MDKLPGNHIVVEDVSQNSAEDTVFPPRARAIASHYGHIDIVLATDLSQKEGSM